MSFFFFFAQSYINILRATRIWDGCSLKHWLEEREKERKKVFFPGNGKQFLIVSIHILKNLKKIFSIYIFWIPLPIHFFYLEDKLTFDFYAIIILCHLSKINVIDFPFLFSCIEEKLRSNKWLLRHLTKVRFLGFVLSKTYLKLRADKNTSDVNGSPHS